MSLFNEDLVLKLKIDDNEWTNSINRVHTDLKRKADQLGKAAKKEADEFDKLILKKVTGYQKEATLKEKAVAKTKQYTAATEKNTKAQYKNLRSLKDVEAGLNLLVRGLRMVGGAYVKAMTEGNKYKNMIQSQVIEIDSARKATKGLISDYQLTQQSNMAMAMNVTKSNKQFAEMARLSTIVARKLGVDANDAISRVTRGIGKMEVELLDELGIRVRINEVLRVHAQKLGKSTTKLSQNERQMALNVAVMDKMKDIAGDTTLEVSNMGDEFTQMTNSLDNFWNGLAAFLASSAAGNFGTWMKDMTVLGGELRSWLEWRQKGHGQVALPAALARKQAVDAAKGYARAAGKKYNKQWEPVDAKGRPSMLFGPSGVGKGKDDRSQQTQMLMDPSIRQDPGKHFGPKAMKMYAKKIADSQKRLKKVYDDQYQRELDSWGPKQPARDYGGAGKGKKAKRIGDLPPQFSKGKHDMWFNKWKIDQEKKREAKRQRYLKSKERSRVAEQDAYTFDLKEKQRGERARTEQRKAMERDRQASIGDVGGDLSGMGGGGWSGIKKLAGNDGWDKIKTHMHDLKYGMNNLGETSAGVFGAMTAGVDAFASGFNGMFSAFGKGMFQAVQGEKSFGEAVKEQMGTWIKSWGQKMMMLSMENSAMALMKLAMGDYPGAGMAAGAAAAYGAAAAVAGLAARGFRKKEAPKKKTAGTSRGLGGTKSSGGRSSATFVYNINTVIPPDPEDGAIVMASMYNKASNMGLIAKQP